MASLGVRFYLTTTIWCGDGEVLHDSNRHATIVMSWMTPRSASQKFIEVHGRHTCLGAQRHHLGAECAWLCETRRGNLAFGDTFHNDRHQDDQTADALVNRGFNDINQGYKRLPDDRYGQYDELLPWRAGQRL